MESIQKFFYDLFLGVNWDKTYCEYPTTTVNTVIATEIKEIASKPNNNKLAADLLPFMLKQLPSTKN